VSHSIERVDAIDSSVTQPHAILWLWALYPLLIPFYFMGRTLNPGTQKFLSGVPQVADYYLAGLMGLVFLSVPFRLLRATIPVVGALALFVGYTGLINFIWATRLEDLSLLKSTLFYVYDVLLFVTCLLLYERYKDQFLKVTVYAVAASVLLQAILSPFAHQEGMSRQALFFNDENQLGYYCVLAATIFVLGARHFAIPTWYQAVFYTALGYLAVLSQCRGGLVALGVLLFVSVLERPLRLLLVLGTLGAVYFLMTLEPSLLGKSEERLVQAGEYDSAETRGYDRILSYPEHILVGAGEGAYERFRSALYASEIHSSYGTLLFCYGIVGTTLFGAALFWIVRGDPRSALFLLPAFAYGSAHHGLRAAFFWVMLAVLCCIALGASRPARKGAAVPA
jgi:hypothetical protein